MNNTEERYQLKVDLSFGILFLIIDSAFALAVLNVFLGNGWDPLGVKRGFEAPAGVLIFLAIFLGLLSLGVWITLSSLARRHRLRSP